MKRVFIFLFANLIAVLLPTISVLAEGCCLCTANPAPEASATITVTASITADEEACTDQSSWIGGIHCVYYNNQKVSSSGRDCEAVASDDTATTTASSTKDLSAPTGIVEASHELEALPDVFGGLSPAKPAEAFATIVGRVINIFLSIIGTITVVMVVYGGWMWMTAQGNDAKIAKATKILLWAFGGVVLVFVSFILVKFIFEILNV